MPGTDSDDAYAELDKQISDLQADLGSAEADVAALNTTHAGLQADLQTISERTSAEARFGVIRRAG